MKDFKEYLEETEVSKYLKVMGQKIQVAKHILMLKDQKKELKNLKNKFKNYLQNQEQQEIENPRYSG